jgi:hypothetical protein
MTATTMALLLALLLLPLLVLLWATESTEHAPSGLLATAGANAALLTTCISPATASAWRLHHDHQPLGQPHHRLW